MTEVHTTNYLEETGIAWSENKVAAYRDVFMEFLNCWTIASKERGNMVLGGNLNGAQERVVETIFAGLRRGIHDFKFGKGRQQGISTICRPFSTLWIAMHPGARGAFVLDTSTHMQEAREEVEHAILQMPKRLRFPAWTSNRYGGRFSNGSNVTFLSAGTRTTAASSALGRGRGVNVVHSSEVGTWGAPEAVVSFEKSLAKEWENRLYLWESTGRNVGSIWWKMWQDARANDLEELTCFTGWWCIASNRIPRNSPLFERYGTLAPTKREKERIALVADLYGHEITPEQLAWIRKETNPRAFASDAEIDEDGFDAEDDYQVREDPWCVTGETLVGTDSGLIPIKDVTVGMKGTLGPVVASMPMGKARIWKIRTSLGYELRGTYHHPIITEDGNQVWLRDCQNEKVRLCPPRFSDKPCVVSWKEGVVESRVEITSEFARLVGLFMGDGSLSGRGPRSGFEFCIACNGKDQDVVAECHRLIRSLFGVNTQERVRGGGVWVRTTSKVIYETFDRLGLLRVDTGKTMRRVHVPDFIFRSPKPIAREFLRGLFETDGNRTRKDHVRFFTKYELFARDVQRLLLAFGVTCRVSKHDKVVRKEDGTEYRFVGYDLDLRKFESAKFLDEIGFLSERKNYGQIEPDKTSRRSFPLDYLDTVVSVEDTGEDEEVYNLTIEGDHLFDANGILTHNTEDEMFTTDGSNFFAGEVLTKISKIQCSDDFTAWTYRPNGAFMDMVIDRAASRRETHLKVWQEPKPDATYIVAADPAFGANERNDRSAAQVLRCYADRIEQVAEFASPVFKTHEFAWVLASLMGWYKNTRLMLEINGPGNAVWFEYQSLKRIMNTYLRKEAEERGLKDFFMNAKNYLYSRPDALTPGQGSVHWKTTGANKVFMMERFRDFVANGGLIIRSREVIEEMRVITRDGDSIKAEGSDHDDRVLALAMGILCWEQQERPRLINLGQTYEMEQARGRMSVSDQFELMTKHHLNRYFRGKEADRMAQMRMAQRMAWRGRV